uniref:Kinesin motor domain-containing protein n=1 Tax=Alexandrium monilatum TaxID=311494 RepID=A0A7S4RK85_9DINO
MSSKEAICVGVRLRPFVAYEKGQKQCLTIRDNVVSVVGEVVGREARDFAFDHAMDSTDPSSANYVDQEKCYDLMSRRTVEHIFQGYNTCLFCYGQTGTGKTTTIMGEVEPVAKQGLLLRLLHDLFEQGAKLQDEGCTMHFRVQMLEVYNDKIRDLLVPADSETRKSPEVHLHPQHGVYVRGMTEDVVESFNQCVKLIDYGNTMKMVAATAMNSKSSRGHTIFKLMLEKRGGSDKTIITSEAFFVDLAGRENEKTTQVTGQRFAELTFINRSLLWLSICIQALGDHASGPSSARRRTATAEGKDRRAPRDSSGPDLDGPNTEGGLRGSSLLSSPQSGRRKTCSTAGKDSPATPRRLVEASASSRFRNSKLTMLLYNALNGNSKTAMIGTLSPAVANFEESLSTLKFASTVKNIKVEAKQATEVDKDCLVKSLQEELRRLKEQMALVNEASAKDVIESRMEWAQDLYEHHKKRWEDEQIETKEMMAKRQEALEKLGIARWNLEDVRKRALPAVLAESMRLECSLPCLMNYSDDPHLSGRFILQPYVEGREYSIGFAEACDFKLPRGLGISPRMCLIRRQGLRMWIRPTTDMTKDGEVKRDGANGEVVMARVEVNSLRIFCEVELQHHDCVVLGRSLMLYAFSKADGGIHHIPADKLPHAQQDRKASNETLVKAILGAERSTYAEQLQLARNYLRNLQGQNMDYDGSQTIHEFLIMAREAARMVEEANAITAELKPNSGLSFELTSMSPVLSFGYGRSSCPELCVRLVRNRSAAEAIRKMTVSRARRQSVHADLLLLDTFTRNGRSESLEVEEACHEVLYTWTFAKFTERLALMNDAREAWACDPENFDLDPISDPWSEYGPSEIASLHQEHREKLESSHEEIERLRQNMQVLADGTGTPATPSGHPVQRQLQPGMQQSRPLLTGMLSNAVADGIAAEVHRLRESNCRLELENTRLKADLHALEARVRGVNGQCVQVPAGRPLAQAHVPVASGACRVLPAAQVQWRPAAPLNGCTSPRRAGDSGSPLLLSILDLSKTNLLLVLDLFDTLSRLSNAMLHASAACLQAPAETDLAVQAARSRLAEAAEDLAAFFAATGPLAQHARVAAGGQANRLREQASGGGCAQRASDQASEVTPAWSSSTVGLVRNPGPASATRLQAAPPTHAQLPAQHMVRPIHLSGSMTVSPRARSSPPTRPAARLAAAVAPAPVLAPFPGPGG